MFKEKRPIGTVLAGLSVVIREDGEEIILEARCRKSEATYLLAVLTDKLNKYAKEEEENEEERPRPTFIKRK